MKLTERFAVLITASVVCLNVAKASGTRGGGHVIDIDSTPHLMDLVTKAVCDWKTGAEMINELPEIQNALGKLKRLDWYFAEDLRQAITELSFCMTGPLYRFAAYGPESLVAVPQNERPRQVAYRLYENAYIDTDTFNSMPSSHKAMLIIHETMHTYLDMNTFDRALKLRSMVKVLEGVRSGEVVSREKLHFSMQKNSILFPTSVEMLEKNKDAIMFLKSSFNNQMNLVKKSTMPESLIVLSKEQIAVLAPWDQFLAPSRESQLKEALLGLMHNSSPEDLSDLIDNKIYQNIDPIKVSLSEIYTIEVEQKKSILETKRFSNIIENGLSDLLVPQVSYNGYLVMANRSLQEMGNVNSGSEVQKSLLSIEPARALPRSLNWLPMLMIILHDSGKLHKITNNEKFYQAFGLKVQKEEVKKMITRIEREKKVALTRLELMAQAMVSGLLESLRSKVDGSTYDSIVKEIKMDQF